MRSIPLSMALAALLALPLHAEPATLTEGHARTAYAGAPSGAAFLVLDNPGPDPLHLIGARYDGAARVELHTHLADSEGVMRMREVEGGFVIPPGGTLLMQRGGDHVMFMGLSDPWADGDMIEIVLIFADGSEQAVAVPVQIGAGE